MKKALKPNRLHSPLVSFFFFRYPFLFLEYFDMKEQYLENEDLKALLEKEVESLDGDEDGLTFQGLKRENIILKKTLEEKDKMLEEKDQKLEEKDQEWMRKLEEKDKENREIKRKLEEKERENQALREQLASFQSH